MIQCVIFDLSEVLIAGLVGVEKELSQEISVPEEEILPGFGGKIFESFLVGSLSEDAYLKNIVSREGWAIDISRLKRLIRANFHNQVDGSLGILRRLPRTIDLVLHSDHGREWVAYIKTVHPFIKMFKHTFFSYELEVLKSDPDAFLKVLNAVMIPPQNCLFVDDNPQNIRVARAVGIPGIHFENSGQLAEDLRKLGILP